MKKHLFLIYFLFYSGFSLGSENKLQITTGYEYRDFSENRGHSSIGHVEFKNKFDNGALVIDIAGGERDFGGGESHTGVKGKTDIYYDWTESLSTRTSITLSNSNPAFVNEEYLQEFNIKVPKNIVILAGAKYDKYDDKTELWAYSGGLTLYTKRLNYSYKYTHYDSSKPGNSYGNLFSIKLKDKNSSGSTQLWLTQGKNAYSYDWLPNSSFKGNIKGVSLRRVQPITNSTSIGVSAGRVWYKPPSGKFHSTEGKADLIYTW